MALPRLKLLFAALGAILLVGWLLSLPAGEFSGGFWPIRHQLIYGSGVLAIGFMSAAVILAARPVQIESALGGLDKFYRLHKWLGIAGPLMALIHWLLEKAPRWLVAQGWLVRPARPLRGASAAHADLFDNLREAGTQVGEIGLYLLIVLVVLALWKRFPYHLFFKTHRLMAPVYLVLVFHAVVLMEADYWTAPVGPLLGLLMAGGTVAAAASLFGRIGKSRRAVGKVVDLKRYPGNAVLDVGVTLDTAWPGHQAGQFAFLDFDDPEGAHPFTISSSWRDDGKLLFTIKGLGDYTRRLPDLLRVGQAVNVEGPYGCFDFSGTPKRQIWIAGGVGITPFIARLEALAGEESVAPVDLIYSTAAPDDGFIAHVSALAAKTGVRLHLLVTPRDGLLTLERLEQLIPQWLTADVWFCGPSAFGTAMREAMTKRGFPTARFHQELFEMR